MWHVGKRYICKQNPYTEQNFRLSLQFLFNFLHKHPKWNIYIYICRVALYINTAGSFKSNITKIYYGWPPISILLFERTSACISEILRILVCDMVAMPETLILFAVRDNLTSQGISVWVRWNLHFSKKSEGGDYFHHVDSQKINICSTGRRFFQADMGISIRSIHSAVYIHEKFM